MTVLVQGTDIGASTDAQGAFELAVPASGAAGPRALTFSAIGFVRQERSARAGQPLSVVLAADTHMLGGLSMGIVVTSVSGRKPWHPRRLFNWGKYWVSKPFQK